jgi:hypothetical protein
MIDRIGLGAAGGQQLQRRDAVGVLARQPGGDPPAERLADQVRPRRPDRVEVGQQVLDVARDLVGVVGLPVHPWPSMSIAWTA